MGMDSSRSMSSNISPRKSICWVAPYSPAALGNKIATIGAMLGSVDVVELVSVLCAVSCVVAVVDVDEPVSVTTVCVSALSSSAHENRTEKTKNPKTRMTLLR
jgi:hypothetical protein